MKNNNRLAIVILIVLLSSTLYSRSENTFEENDDIIKIHFNLESNRPVVDVLIEGKKFKFIFDTGASGAIVTRQMYEVLGLKSLGKIKVGSPNNPEAISTVKTKIELMEIGDYKFKNIGAVVIDLNIIMPHLKIDGIIGPNNFEDYMITLDYLNKIIFLQKGSLDTNDRGVINTTFSRIVALDIFINDDKFEGHIDTGAPSFITIPFEWRDKFTFEKEPEFERKAKLASGEVDIYNAKLVGSVRLDDIVIRNPEINLITGGFNAVNLGYEFLKNYKLTIDKKSNLIKLESHK